MAKVKPKRTTRRPAPAKRVHYLQAEDLTTGSPELGEPTIGQTHRLAARDLSPTYGPHHLKATGIGEAPAARAKKDDPKTQAVFTTLDMFKRAGIKVPPNPKALARAVADHTGIAVSPGTAKAARAEWKRRSQSNQPK